MFANHFCLCIYTYTYHIQKVFHMNELLYVFVSHLIVKIYDYKYNIRKVLPLNGYSYVLASHFFVQNNHVLCIEMVFHLNEFAYDFTNNLYLRENL